MPTNLRLQEVPQAFLDALGLKVEGRNPAEFSDVVGGVVDMMDHYVLARQQLGATNNTLGVLGDTLGIPIPSGEVWRCHAVSVTVTITMATLLAGRIAYLPTAGALRIALGSVYAVIPATGLPSNYTFQVIFERPLLFLPGSTIQFALDAALAAPDVVALRTLHEVIDY